MMVGDLEKKLSSQTDAFLIWRYFYIPIKTWKHRLEYNHIRCMETLFILYVD